MRALEKVFKQERLRLQKFGIMDEESIYCVFCETGAEEKVKELLESKNVKTIASVAEYKKFVHGRSVIKLRQLIPGYVFLQTDRELDYQFWSSLEKEKYIYYPLQYDDGDKKLHGKDLDFIRVLLSRNGILGISKAVLDKGNFVKIVSGPLKDLEGKIVRMNKKRECAEIEIETFGITIRAWLQYELIANDDTGAGLKK
jgi:transcriptional antiterminator NusG